MNRAGVLAVVRTPETGSQGSGYDIVAEGAILDEIVPVTANPPAGQVFIQTATAHYRGVPLQPGIDQGEAT